MTNEPWETTYPQFPLQMNAPYRAHKKKRAETLASARKIKKVVGSIP